MSKAKERSPIQQPPTAAELLALYRTMTPDEQARFCHELLGDESTPAGRELKSRLELMQRMHEDRRRDFRRIQEICAENYGRTYEDTLAQVREVDRLYAEGNITKAEACKRVKIKYPKYKNQRRRYLARGLLKD